jgi:enhancing lycopene biosynthesis protein 2
MKAAGFDIMLVFGKFAAAAAIAGFAISPIRCRNPDLVAPDSGAITGALPS